MECQSYVLDSNVFIQAANQYYAFDLVPSFGKGRLHADRGKSAKH